LSDDAGLNAQISQRVRKDCDAKLAVFIQLIKGSPASGKKIISFEVGPMNTKEDFVILMYV
jgi:hypothetical protein